MRSFWQKLLITAVSAGIFFCTAVFILYKWAVPALVNNPSVINYIQDKSAKVLNSDIKIDGAKLKTGRSIAFTVDSFVINKNGKNILTLKNIDTLIDLRDLLLHRRIIVKKLLAEEIYADVNDILSVLPQQKKKKKEKKKTFITADMYNVLMGVKKCRVLYDSEKYSVDLSARHMIFDRTKARKYLHFDFDFILSRDGRRIEINADDMNRFYMENKKAYIVDFPIEIDNSKITVNAVIDNKGKYELNIKAKNYSASDIANAVSSNIFVANGREMLAPITDIRGRVDFGLNITNSTLKGKIKINEAECKIVPLLNLPVKATNGDIIIDEKNITFENFEGYYNNNKTNTLSLKGDIRDYQKTCDTKLVSKIHITNDFFKNYLSKMLNSPIGLVGDAGSFLVLKTKNGKPIDIQWYFLLREKEGFKFGEQSMVLQDYNTLFKVDLSIIKNILKINTINYYITNELKKGIKPILTLNGSVDMADNMKIQELNLDIPQPLPSEFLNFIMCQKIFRKGNVSGQMSIKDNGKFPVMSGEFALNKVIIPAQGMYIRSGKMIAHGDTVTVKMNGRLNRENFTFDGNVTNAVKLPVVVKDVNLTVDNINVEKVLNSQQIQNDGQSQQETQNTLSTTAEDNEETLEMPAFQKGLLIIEKCTLDLKNGVYKEINFANVHADMTLNKDGVLNLKSNRFDIADGTSSLKVNADLVNRNYYLKLGVKDVNSDIMASAILGLPRQISGKAKGLIELNADKTLKLNGDIKFKINNGTIEQVGYVEYILKVASLFRNPLAMFSPTTVFDLVNIPEGKFDVISGEMSIKDNIIRRINIKSTADELATFITGRYDLSSNDASIRVYTKFTDKDKGFAGFMRNISLNTLANKISISSRNDSNYYASELAEIPELKENEEDAQVFLTKIDGDVINFNFLSSLKRIK